VDVSIPLLISTYWGNSNNAYIYRAYNIKWKATDSWDKIQEQYMVFYNTELEGEAILIREYDLQAVSSKWFIKITQKEANKGMFHIYVVVC
jgi:hypothetical protein